MSQTRNPHILVAEDDPRIRAVVVYRLERAGYTVTSVGDGEEALRVATEQQPDLALLDVVMPKMDGFDVARNIRATASTASMPVIMLTARDGESDVDRGFAAGADDYLRKPFSPHELRLRVQAALGRR